MGSVVKAITVRQPYASLIAAGVKTIETRPRQTHYRGRAAIHAAKREPIHGDELGDSAWYWEWDFDHGIITNWRTLASRPAPLGAVVASAVLTDCVPMHDTCAEPIPDDLLYVTIDGRGLYRQQVIGDPWVASNVVATDLTDQLPYGDFTPGRWALLLDDIKPTTERCPWCWGGAVDTDGWCRVCDDDLRCDPIPARGQQAIPWEWTP